MGDFDGNGALDIAAVTASGVDGGLSVLLGKGDGTFRTVSTIFDNANGLVAADFSGDHKDDLAIATGGDVAILISNGDGTFTSSARLQTPTGFIPVDVVAADLNADGKQDVVAVDFSASAIVYLGHGNGTFFSPTIYDAGQSPTAALATDVDGDGKVDLAVVGGAQSAGTLNILLGGGDGTFQSAAGYNLGGTPTEIRAADVTGDGVPDLVVANSDKGGVQVIIGSAGALPGQASLVSGVNPSGIATADFDRDGHVDVAVASEADGLVEILWGATGSSSLGVGSKVAMGGAPHAIVAADFDRDGKTDIAVADDQKNSVSVMLNRSK